MHDSTEQRLASTVTSQPTECSAKNENNNQWPPTKHPTTTRSHHTVAYVCQDLQKYSETLFLNTHTQDSRVIAACSCALESHIRWSCLKIDRIHRNIKNKSIACRFVCQTIACSAQCSANVQNPHPRPHRCANGSHLAWHLDRSGPFQ